MHRDDYWPYGTQSTITAPKGYEFTKEIRLPVNVEKLYGRNRGPVYTMANNFTSPRAILKKIEPPTPQSFTFQYVDTRPVGRGEYFSIAGVLDVWKSTGQSTESYPVYKLVQTVAKTAGVSQTAKVAKPADEEEVPF